MFPARAAVVAVLLLPVATALEPAWDTPRLNERIGDRGVVLLHPQAVVAGTAAHIHLSGPEVGEGTIHITRDDGTLVHEETLDVRTLDQNFRAAGGFWHVPADLAPGRLALRVETGTHVLEGAMEAFAAPHLFVENAAPPATGERIHLEATGFEGPVDLTILQAGQRWTGTFDEGKGEPLHRGEVATEATAPGAVDPQRVLLLSDGDQSVRASPIMLGGAFHAWFNGTVNGAPTSVAWAFEAPPLEGAAAWLFDGLAAPGGRVHVAGFGFEGLVRILQADTTLVEVTANDGFWSAVVTAPQEEGRHTLRIEDARHALELTLEVQAPPMPHGSPGPGLLLSLLAVSLALAWRRRG